MPTGDSPRRRPIRLAGGGSDRSNTFPGPRSGVRPDDIDEKQKPLVAETPKEAPKPAPKPAPTPEPVQAGPVQAEPVSEPVATDAAPKSAAPASINPAAESDEGDDENPETDD